MHWYAVPTYSGPRIDVRPHQARPADVVDEAGEHVATFERLCDAEEAADLHNLLLDSALTMSSEEAA